LDSTKTDSRNTKELIIVTGLFTLMVISSHRIGMHYASLLVVGAVLLAYVAPLKLKPLFWTFSAYVMGYVISSYLKVIILKASQAMVLSVEMTTILSRLSLIGYLIPLIVLGFIYKGETNYFRVGQFRNEIRFPFIWWGIRDPMWRFICIALTLMLGVLFFLIDFKQEQLGQLLFYSFLFACINSILEEILWRGYILARFVDVYGEKLGLVGASVGFGFYHYSLGFGLPICLLFAITGLMLGGVVIRSKGLLPTVLIHFVMNIIFAFLGIIFN
jgi:membrane protease YdiL (CAAX protease family)